MPSPQNRRRLILAASFLALTATGLVWQERRVRAPRLLASPVGSAPAFSTTPVDPASLPPPATAGPLTAHAARVNSEEIWDFNVTGTPSSIVLALDEAVLRDRNGKEKVHPLSPPATQETLPARLAELSAPGGVFPVAYLVGEERSTATRRLVTPDLRVQLDAAAAEKVAAQNHLVIKDRPSYAPGWVIMSAGDAFAALDAMVNLRTLREVVSADVLLAVQHSLRALPNDPLIGDQWHLKRSGTAVAGTDVNIESVWNYPAAAGIRGAGVRIGIIDDGLQLDHPDLAANVDPTNHKDWNGGDPDPSPEIGDDHGTSCAGNAAARANNGRGVSGAAPMATLVGMRLISASVTDAQEAEALSYLPDIVQVKSNSWGPADNGATLEGPQPLATAALQNAAATGRGGKGTLFLWAAGNGGDVRDNSNYDGYANSIYTIAIGAIDSTGTRSYYSEPGANVVVCAPSNGGLGITTVDRTDADGYNTASSANGGDYTNDFGGTSSATPTAAGIVALILEKNPNLGWRDVQEILIRSAAKFKPADAGWATNGAGIPFNHDFGAGLIDATAAVNLAGTWTNLAAQTSATSSQTGLSVAIPNNNTTGITRTFDLSASNVRIEQVTLKLSATHTARGNLDITLTAPGGMVSKLAAVHSDSGDNYSNWTFSSVRHWGELSAGTWTLKIADVSSTGNSTGGTLTGAELTVFGTQATPVNPPPLTQITQPAGGQVFSPGASVTIAATATDLTLGGTAGTVTQVAFYGGTTLLGTDSAAPYTFTFSPAVGSHSLVAKATDSEGAVGTSASVNISVINQPPVLTTATLSATGQAYADVPLTVASITASDPESFPLTYTYQWQSSVNQSVYTDEPGATSATAPALPGKLLRCVVTASDGISVSTPFTTAAVNLLARPVLAAPPGAAYTYTSGLVLRGSDSPLSRRAIINEFSQGPSGGTAEWIELLTLQDGSLAGWHLADAAGNTLLFLDAPAWAAIPAGTLIVIYNATSKDALLPGDDADPADGRMVISSTDRAFFDATSASWLPLGNSGDSIFLTDKAGAAVHSVAYGNTTGATLNVGSVGSAKSAYFAGDTDAAADLPASWRVTTSLTARALQTRAAATLPLTFGGPWSPLPAGLTGTGLGTYTTSLGGDTATGSAKFDDTADSLVVEISAQAGSLTYQIKGNPASGTATAGTFLVQQSADGAAYTTLRTVANASNTDTAYTDTPAAATRFIKFLYQTKSAGNVQLDKLALTPATPPNTLTLAISPATFAENLGAAAATGTVTLAAPLAAALTVTLASSDTGEATLHASITIAAGQTSSPTFSVTAVDDLDSDGPQSVTLTATAAGFVTGSALVTVTDNEPSVEGVTPAAANNPANQTFLTALRNGSLNNPALFRLGAGTTLPAGLALDPATGTLSGTLALSNPAGAYPVVIERYNSLGEIVSQSFTLTLGAGGTFAGWIATQPVGLLTGVNDDPDFDGLPNAIENILGTSPAAPSLGLTTVFRTASALVFRHTQSHTPATDLTATYEWSTDLTRWHPSATSDSGTTVTFTSEVITTLPAPAPDLVQVTATLTGVPRPDLFVRLKAVR